MIKAICFVICGKYWGLPCAQYTVPEQPVPLLLAAETESGESNVLVAMQVCWL